MHRRAFLASLAASAATPAFGQVWAPPPEPPAVLHPQAQRCLGHLQRRRWSALSDAIVALPPQSANVLLYDLGDMTEVDSYVSPMSEQPMGDTLIGALNEVWGWRFRGEGWGHEVAPASFTHFRTRLERAKASLEAALARDPDDGVAATFLIRAEKGLESRPAIETAFRALLRARRQPIAGFAQFADAISDKWYGSQDEMIAFARSYSASLPPASYALIAEAHCETMIRLLQASEDEAVQARALQYLSSQTVLREIRAADERFTDSAPDEDPFQMRFGHAAFSFAFYFAEQRDLARPHFVALGPHGGGMWSRLEGGYEEARRELGLETL